MPGSNNYKIKSLINVLFRCFQYLFEYCKNSYSNGFVELIDEKSSFCIYNKKIVHKEIPNKNYEVVKGSIRRKKGFLKKYNQITVNLELHPLYIKSNFQEKVLVNEYIQKMIETQLYGSIAIGIMAIDFMRVRDKKNNIITENFINK